MIVATVG
jgi:hypothetical protein